MMLEFEVIADPSGKKTLIIFERGRREQPLVVLWGGDIERLKRVVLNSD